MIAAKNCSHLSRSQYDRHRHVAREGAHLPAAAFRPVECEEKKPRLFGTHGFTNLFHSGNCETRSAG
jgi:hypothetical protein